MKIQISFEFWKKSDLYLLKYRSVLCFHKFFLIIDDAKISSWAPRRSGWMKLWLGSSLLDENLQNELGGRVTRRCGISQTASDD